MNELFSIGHSNHDIGTFLELLERHGIELVADVRSSPYSRWAPWFNIHSLKTSLEKKGMDYLFLGEEFGARREEPECYIGSKADYGLISKTTAFKRGLKRLKAEVRSRRIALMCAERDPLDCHRTILVARHAMKFADVSHIHFDCHLETHAEAEKRLLQRYGLAPDIFHIEETVLSEAYMRRADEIAFVRQ